MGTKELLIKEFIICVVLHFTARNVEGAIWAAWQGAVGRESGEWRQGNQRVESDATPLWPLISARTSSIFSHQGWIIFLKTEWLRIEKLVLWDKNSCKNVELDHCSIYFLLKAPVFLLKCCQNIAPCSPLLLSIENIPTSLALGS